MQSLAAAEPDAPYVYAIRTAAVSQCLYTFFDLLVFPFAAFALLAAPWRTASVYRHMAACVAAEPDSPYVAQVRMIVSDAPNQKPTFGRNPLNITRIQNTTNFGSKQLL